MNEEYVRELVLDAETTFSEGIRNGAKLLLIPQKQKEGYLRAEHAILESIRLLRQATDNGYIPGMIMRYSPEHGCEIDPGLLIINTMFRRNEDIFEKNLDDEITLRLPHSDQNKRRELFIHRLMIEERKSRSIIANIESRLQ